MAQAAIRGLMVFGKTGADEDEDEDGPAAGPNQTAELLLYECIRQLRAGHPQAAKRKAAGAFREIVRVHGLNGYVTE